MKLSSCFLKRAHPQLKDLVTADEVIMEEVVVGLPNGQQQARPLFSKEPIPIHSQCESMQLGLCSVTRYVHHEHMSRKLMHFLTCVSAHCS